MGIKRRSYHRLGDKDFSTIKALLEAGLGVSKIHEITGRSFGVIGLIRNSNTLNDYRLQVKKITAKFSVKPVKTEEVEIKVEKNATLSDVVEELKNTNSILERLAVAWENRPAKRGLFDR
jgi:hypothetical protein